MKTLAHTLVTVQEASEKLNAGMALENMHGEYFYFNDCWPKIYSISQEKNKRNDPDLYPPNLAKAIKASEAEILHKKLPIGYLVNNSENKEPKTTHLVLKFIINCTSGTPFCFCTLAKRIENGDELIVLLRKVKEIFKIENDPKLFNHAEGRK